ncbi:hypothetical protein MHU86_2911 [Fragilaria crotonensis]|nr:hypothetical protein MHU86_2911 [Fragilaria crotonensis]
MVTLRRLGHETDLNFFRSSNPSSFPIKFNFRKKEVAIVAKVDSDSGITNATQENVEKATQNDVLRQEETAQVETEAVATSQDETTQVEAETEEAAPSVEETSHVETETEEATPSVEETSQVENEREEAVPMEEDIAEDISEYSLNPTTDDADAMDEREAKQYEEL